MSNLHRKQRVEQQWVNQLLDGVPGEKVVEHMRKHYTPTEGPKKGVLNECTLRTKVTDVKKMALLATPKKGQRNVHPDYKSGLEKLRGLKDDTNELCARSIDAFLNPPDVREDDEAGRRYEQMKLLRKSRSTHGRKSLCRHFDGNEDVQRVFAELRLLPDNFETFRVKDVETERCKRTSETRLLRKDVFVVNDAYNMLQYAKAVLEKPGVFNIQEVIAALLFVSGRRTTEILNCRSTFEPMAHGYRHGCAFSGQLKTNHNVNTMTYTIPLIVPFSVFINGLDAVRNWQKPTANIKALTNRQVSRRYQPNLQRHLAEHGFAGVLGIRPHLLRAIYMRFVLEMFDWGKRTERRVAKYCLGHSSSQHQQHYDHVELKNDANLKTVLIIRSNRLGSKRVTNESVFPLSESELQRVEELVSNEGEIV